MLHSIKKLEHCRILATDAEVGSVSDTYFDDARWVVRYLIVEGSGHAKLVTGRSRAHLTRTDSQRELGRAERGRGHAPWRNQR